MRKGLFIGINNYQYVSPLSGCHNDAIATASLLERHANGRPNFSNKVLTSAQDNLTLATLKQHIKSLFSDDCDVALLYFAGHGQFDTNIDEGLLIPQDFEPGGEGIRISDILNWATDASRIKNKIIILDCCQAGAAGAMRGLRAGTSVLGEGVTILTACKQHQSALETGGHGVFTGLLLQALHGGAANVLGKVTPGSVYSFVDNALGAWEQRPVFKTNVSQFVPLRDVAPLIAEETLRKLKDWFTDASYVFPLDPSFEPTADTFDPDNGEIFSQLQKCNRHSLIEPVDAEHMYYAAINSTGCRLTALGAYYRELAIKGHF
ncbi:Caspase domain-containing protein [Pseudomonas antarctica]|uniref:Caspase domain protein n=1 Tax=Pseudomonas antarctica TaxID=219572 RepID=A0A1G9UTB1_9PSED|nr:caspase family protein [Pseudomonas antarctica]KAF2408456.1 caspase domain protein [Pseudomonas antarctica]SDM63133.1 Caspase domain-containing protein [Pseudomonas antarctica]